MGAAKALEKKVIFRSHNKSGRHKQKICIIEIINRTPSPERCNSKEPRQGYRRRRRLPALQKPLSLQHGSRLARISEMIEEDNWRSLFLQSCAHIKQLAAFVSVAQNEKRMRAVEA
jgi:hypothetical protein